MPAASSNFQATFVRDGFSRIQEAAQHAKFDLVCRKLRLQPGESVVEAGCGWGTLALHMTRKYGVRVKAFNVSREQLAYARDRARREGCCPPAGDQRPLHGHRANRSGHGIA